MDTGTQRITDLQRDLRNTPSPGSSKLVSLERPELVEEQETRPMGHNLAQQVVETLQTPLASLANALKETDWLYVGDSTRKVLERVALLKDGEPS